MVKPFTNTQHILENLNIIVIVLNTKATIEYLNPAAEIFFSISLDRVYHRSVLSLFPDDELHNKIISAIEIQNTFIEREYKLKFNQHTSVVDISVTPILDKHKNLEIILEITPQDRYIRLSREENLFSQQQVTRELLCSMAHEVKNPLGGIRGAAQLLEKELHSDNLKEYTQVIISEADRLKLLVDRMLGPKSHPNKQWINIHSVTERVRNLMHRNINYPIEFCFDYDPSIPDIYADSEHLIQAILNLTTNAAQAIIESSCEQKVITLKTRVKRHFTIGPSYHQLILKLDIIDTGPGIKKQILEHIFMPLITGRPEGTGLGLSIAQSLINQNQGLIECKSSPGRTVFSVLLPIDTDSTSNNI